MKQISLNEEQLRKLIQENVEKVLMEEGFFDNMKSAFNGAKRGYQAQKTLDRGTQGFKQYHDADDASYEMSHPLRKAENTAEEQAREIYQQYKQYQATANQLLSKYNAMVKQYGLVKQDAPGMVTAPNKPQVGSVPNFGTAPTMRRQTPNPSTQATGLWGK